ncbi:uncharacterized protein [Pagrus major]|uniref:uncharacterized protein n=1 Tax=Pagrus major TaxID=143350 RepID=UPI003CC84BF2
MKDDIRAGEQVEVTRQEVYDDYVKWYLQCTDVRPCRDACLLDAAARYLQREPEPSGTFTLFPFYRSLIEAGEPPSTDYGRLVSDFIKAVELLETLCVNLFLQPWKKEIKTLKTFTGPFVYCLLPVFSSSSIQSVLASIGYLPDTDTQQSEYRLSEDANPDRAMLVGFELLLARVECYRLQELLDKDQPGPQKWLELLQRRVQASKLEEPTEKKTKIVDKEEEEEEKKEEADREEVPQCLDSRLAVNPLLKPRPCHLISVDHSIMEMQMTYPDLAIRGRPLLPDKPHRANSTRGSNKAVHTASTSNSSDDSKAAELHRKDSIKDTKAAATTTCSKNFGSRAAEVFGEDGRSSGQTSVPGDAISSNFSNIDDEPSHPQAVSLHITLRAGSTAEKRLKPGETQPTAEPPARKQKQTTADPQNKRPASPGPPSMSSMDEEQELRELAEKMGQLHVHEAKMETKRKEEKERGEESRNKERRKKERKASTEREGEEQNLRRPVIETGPARSHAARRCNRSSQSDPAVMKEQKKPSPLTVSTADRQSCRGGSSGQQDGEDTERAEAGRGEEEQLAHTYVIV